MTLKRFRDLFVIGFFGAVFLVVGMSSASAGLIVGDANYVGLINDGIPSSPSKEVDYINALTALAAGAAATTCATTETCDRIGSTLNPSGGFAAAVITSAFKDETSTPTVNLTGSTYQYILGKYDARKAGSIVWYSATGFTGNISLPGTLNGQGISHISGYNLTTGIPFIPMPEPSALSLLGLGLLGLGLSRRRIRS